MIPVSNEFKKVLGNDNRNYSVQIDMTLHDGTKLILDNSDIWDGGVSFEESTSGHNSFDIGAAVISKCTIVLNNIYDKFSQYNFSGATFALYIGLELSETTEIIRKGFYTVDDPKYNGSIITLECLDNMWKFDVPYSQVATAYPATLGVIVADICSHCGVSLGKANFPNYTYTIQSRPEKDMNCREVIAYLAQISCFYARISNNGALVFGWYDSSRFKKDYDGGYFDSGTSKYTSGDDLDGGNFTDYTSGDDADGGTFEDLQKMAYIISASSVSVHTDDIVITGVRVLNESKDGYDILYGEDTYTLAIKDNPFVTADNAQTIADCVGSQIVGMFFRPFEASALNDVSVEAGDACVIQDFRGNRYYSFVTNLSFSVWNYETFSCGAETPSRNKTVRYSELAKTAVQIRRETQKKISDYDKAVQNMNQLASNAMGYHTTYEEQVDGSRITYLHDKPNLSESTIIYKQTIDGFFMSQDGGKTYTLGFDSNGNAVMNILSVIGLQADWIKTGTLTVGGYNNQRGIIRVLDKDGNHVGTIDNNGLAFFSSQTGLQVIISPSVGLIQRDSDGNEFYGLVYDKTIQLPSVGSIRQKEVYTGKDEDKLNSEIYDRKTENDMYYVRWHWWYTHNTAYWNSEPTVTYEEKTTSITLSLPDIFKDKKWIVVLMYKGMNNNKGSYQYLSQWSYPSLPICYEGVESYDDEWIGLGATPLLPEKWFEMLASGKTTTHLSFPQPSSGTRDISSNIPNEITSYEFDYVADEEKCLLTISGKAMAGNYCVNELMDIRVLVSC